MITVSPSTVLDAEPATEPLAPFDFQPQGRMVFGAGALGKLGALVHELGGTSVLLVTDPGLEQAGHPQRAVQVLRDAGLDVATFDGVEENPESKHVALGVEVARKHRSDFLVWDGGGSSMDCTKGENFVDLTG